MLRQKAGDSWIAAGEIAFQSDDIVPLESIACRFTVDSRCFIDLAGDAPVGGKIDKDVALSCAKSGKPAFREIVAR